MLYRLMLVLISTALAMPAAAADYSIDVAHSAVQFKVNHMVITKVRGGFDSFKGTIHFNENDLTKSSVSVSIKTDSIDTGNEKRDAHLRSADFFEAEKFPAITFKSTEVQKTNDGYVAKGKLTIRDQTHIVTLRFSIAGPITDPWGGQRIGVEVEPIAIDRRDYGLTWSKALETGGLVVGNDVEIEISIEAVQMKDEAPAT